MKNVYAIEGLDRLGKSTLIKGIQNKQGFYQVVHFGKPEKLELYAKATPDRFWNNEADYAKFKYQEESFRNSMLLARSGARVIFDRWHLGECVYSPIYRKYNGDYVFALEREFELKFADIRLILLVEDFDRSRHFVSDGDSFDDSKRREEQTLFVNAFNQSEITDKRMICVTDLNGNFRNPSSILEEALS